MSLFGFVTKKRVDKQLNHAYLERERARVDRMRIKDNLDKLGAKVTDLECKINSLEGDAKHGKHKRK